jgi:hypothetical protein
MKKRRRRGRRRRRGIQIKEVLRVLLLLRF